MSRRDGGGPPTAWFRLSGIRKPVARSTLATANEQRDWRLFADFAHALSAQASARYVGEPFGGALHQSA